MLPMMHRAVMSDELQSSEPSILLFLHFSLPRKHLYMFIGHYVCLNTVMNKTICSVSINHSILHYYNPLGSQKQYWPETGIFMLAKYSCYYEYDNAIACNHTKFYDNYSPEP